MTFSIATAVLNLTSLGITAQYVMIQLQSLPPGDRGAAGLAAARGRRLAAGRAGADVGAVQRAVPGLRGVRSQHEGRPVLPDAAAAGDACR